MLERFGVLDAVLAAGTARVEGVTLVNDDIRIDTAGEEVTQQYAVPRRAGIAASGAPAQRAPTTMTSNRCMSSQISIREPMITVRSSGSLK
jgi:hypothetical protein